MTQTVTDPVTGAREDSTDNGARHVSIVNPSGAILGSGSWVVVDDQTLTATALNFIFPDLDGSDAFMYRIQGHLIGAGASGQQVRVRCNADSGNRYTWLTAVLGTTYSYYNQASGGGAGDLTGIQCLGGVIAQNAVCMVDIVLYANTAASHLIGGRTHVAAQSTEFTGEWTPAASAEITSIIVDAALSGLGSYAAGSRLQLTKMGVSPL